MTPMRPLVAAAIVGIAMGHGPTLAEPQPLSAYMALPAVAPTERLSYGPDPSQIVELFKPRGRGTHPVVVLLHGGGWRREFQGLAQTSGIAADLARRGVAVWNVEYRGVDEAGGGWPGTFQDVAAALDLLKRKGRAMGLDTGRVVAVGHSAGGHLALWAASRSNLPRDSALRTPDPLPIPVVISLGGAGDMEASADLAASVCGLQPDKLFGARPDRYVDTSPARLLPAGVRVVMIHGAYDHVFPPHVGLDYVRKARKSGDKADVVVIPDAGHFDPVMVGTPAWEIVAARVKKELNALR